MTKIRNSSSTGSLMSRTARSADSWCLTIAALSFGFAVTPLASGCGGSSSEGPDVEAGAGLPQAERVTNPNYDGTKVVFELSIGGEGAILASMSRERQCQQWQVEPGDGEPNYIEPIGDEHPCAFLYPGAMTYLKIGEPVTPGGGMDAELVLDDKGEARFVPSAESLQRWVDKVRSGEISADIFVHGAYGLPKDNPDHPQLSDPEAVKRMRASKDYRTGPKSKPKVSLLDLPAFAALLDPILAKLVESDEPELAQKICMDVTNNRSRHPEAQPSPLVGRCSPLHARIVAKRYLDPLKPLQAFVEECDPSVGLVEAGGKLALANDFKRKISRADEDAKQALGTSVGTSLEEFITGLDVKVDACATTLAEKDAQRLSKIYIKTLKPAAKFLKRCVKGKLKGKAKKVVDRFWASEAGVGFAEWRRLVDLQVAAGYQGEDGKYPPALEAALTKIARKPRKRDKLLGELLECQQALKNVEGNGAESSEGQEPAQGNGAEGAKGPLTCQHQIAKCVEQQSSSTEDLVIRGFLGFIVHVCEDGTVNCSDTGTLDHAQQWQGDPATDDRCNAVTLMVSDHAGIIRTRTLRLPECVPLE